MLLRTLTSLHHKTMQQAPEFYIWVAAFSITQQLQHYV